MRKNIVLLQSLLVVVLVLTSCKRDHFITDREYRNKVEKQFELQKLLAANRSEQLFAVFDQGLPLREEEALKFLYAYMPLSDLADYDGSFFLENVRASFAARDTFAWGKTVPEALFRHFVLPIRVNNENLDSARWVFFRELKDRIKKMTMKEAVLEVNHWCHEKVTYRGTDGRTSSPLSTVKTAYGRCGEESTFTVAALRSVGIPARQCYTPRWAHSDDNHAWVEVWIDGKWHFIGACEPEPDLDLAWFTAPARRAMLVNTNVFGDYEGPEDVLLKDPRFTRINILENYTRTRRVFVKVTDQGEHPVDSATVEFQLYNYAEFYPLHKALTGKDGVVSFLTGSGDLLVWAAKGVRYGYQKVPASRTDTVVLNLSAQPGGEFSETFDLTPPPVDANVQEVSDSLKKNNAAKLKFEDDLRGSYESTFIDSAKAYRLAPTLHLNPDTLWYLLKKSRGNWRELIEFMTGVAKDKKNLIFPLLNTLSDKDLRDATPEALSDAVAYATVHSPLCSGNVIFYPYVLAPRVDNEWLKPYREFFLPKLDPDLIRAARTAPDSLVSWVLANIAIDKTANWGRAPLTPAGSFELRLADDHSRDILFVALCRTIGIPARLEPGSRVPQYFWKEGWVDVRFEKIIRERTGKAQLELVSDPLNDRKPEYYTHFTLEKFKDGFFRSLDYEGSPLVQSFPCTLELSPGYYLMVTGNRIGGGTVLASLKFFNLVEGKKSQQVISIRKEQISLKDYGRINPQLFAFSIKEGMVLAWIDPDKEPTKHFLSDLRMKKQEFGSWNGRIVLIFSTEKEMKSFVAKDASGLPQTVTYSFRDTFPVYLSDIKSEKGAVKNLPVVLYLNGSGVINYLSEGYQIGIGDDLYRIISATMKR